MKLYRTTFKIEIDIPADNEDEAREVASDCLFDGAFDDATLINIEVLDDTVDW